MNKQLVAGFPLFSQEHQPSEKKKHALIHGIYFCNSDNKPPILDGYALNKSEYHQFRGGIVWMLIKTHRYPLVI